MICDIVSFCENANIEQVTSRKDQKQYWARLEEPYQYVSVKQLSCSFQSFRTGRAITSELAIPFDKSKSHPAALTTSRYGVSAKELLKANFDREILLLKRNSFVYIFRAFQVTRTRSKQIVWNMFRSYNNIANYLLVVFFTW